MVQSNVKHKFSGHQTFAFRYGWLEKGVRGLLLHEDLFVRPDALVIKKEVTAWVKSGRAGDNESSSRGYY